MKKKYIIAVIVILFVVIDLSVLLYPTVSDYINSKNQSRALLRYIDDVAGMDGANTQKLLEAAREYNKELQSDPNRFDFTEEETKKYKDELNVGNGIMGVLEIDKINVRLPIYHGTDEGVLQVGLGHLPGSSLPVGGIGTHTVITGHRGLPSSKLLTDLNKMAEGDTFVIYAMGETLLYQVDQIRTVNPEELQNLNIDPEKDYCTLVTCTPYGINTHRLLVRGHRIENTAARSAGTGWETISAGAGLLDKINIILIFMVPVLPVLTIYFIIRSVKIRKQKGGILKR